ncbi:MAG TPA: NAD(P)-dependent oxidoreductase [Myxococcota bacterium]|nr:NAD(P)-dependent oxidoreductase [Myxococcota bacterium]
MQELRDHKILVTGLTGQVARPIALDLAPRNEVWGIARFSNPALRTELEAGGVRCETFDLEAGDFSALPADFDVVLHFAVSRAPKPDFDRDLRANAEASGLLLAHTRPRVAFFHCSTTGVYEANGHTVFTEDSPLGDNHRVMMPTYSIAKIAAEAVVRTMARRFAVPTVIARLNTPYGETGGWPWYHLLMMKNGVPIPVHTDAPSRYTLLHQRDIVRTLPGLVAAASVPARIVNWCGREHVSIEEWCAYLGELTGLEPKFEPTSRTLQSVMTDDARMRALVGPAEVPWKQGLREMVEKLAPELLR